MTISYASEVPNGSAFGCFWRILIKWRGSVYKLIWRELLVYLFAYYFINFIYRYALNEEQQRIFEKIRYYFGNSSESIPMSFVLGFYVSLVVKRWWEQYKLLPWPDNLALFISAAIPGNDERGRLMRRNIVRYAVLAYVITLQRISLRVKRRFPSLQHIVDVGLMMESEKKIFEMMNKKAGMSKYWMPLVWATNIINRARKEQLITSDHVVQTLLVELSDIRKKLGGLIGYDTVCVPLVYTQVVTLSLYAYFFSALLGRQFISHSDSSVSGKYEVPDMYFPFFTALQFCFYVGWLKVAEVLINPFGEDDDDIELNWLIDRHIKAGYMIVDEMHEEHPELLKDQYWDEVVPKDLPYTVASEQYRKEEPKGSAEHYKVKSSDALYANVFMGTHVHGGPANRSNKQSHMQDDVYADYESVDTPLVERKSKNWLQRTITRMGSVRSSSTTYSSGGPAGGNFFTRNRHNSVYSSPENPLQNAEAGIPGPPSAKQSFYERLRRKSMQGRGMRRQGTLTKLNSIPTSLKNRPRIPTPDVTKEVIDREQRLAVSASNVASIGAGIVGMPAAHATSYHNPASSVSSDVSVLQGQAVLLVNSPANIVQLSPIQEKTELGTPVGARQSAAQHLAHSVLPQSLKSGASVTAQVAAIPVTLSALSQLVSSPDSLSFANRHRQACINTIAPSQFGSPSQQVTATITELSSNASSATDDESQPNNASSVKPADKLPETADYTSCSPIIVDPQKLNTVAQSDWHVQNYKLIPMSPTKKSKTVESNSHSKARRSTSLPGATSTSMVDQIREDRSMSLPHTIVSPPSEKVSTTADVELTQPPPFASTLLKPTDTDDEPRQRSGSFNQPTTTPKIVEENARKISLNDRLNFLDKSTNGPTDQRSEVYV
uniref:Bestrophin homolog n=1 Tax=Trichogramma kaykai TaxID=54128 RepID=A0ABD2WFY7_9HYME